MKKKQLDFYFLFITLTLLLFGLIMLASASSEFAREYENDAYHYIKRQGVFALVGIGIMYVVASMDYHIYEKYALLILGGSLALNIAVLFIGEEVKGGKRWIDIGFTNIQPSEIAKLSLVILFAYLLSNKKNKLKYFIKGLLPHLMLLGLIAGIVLLQKHYSGTAIIVLIGVIMLFTAGARWWHLGMLGIAGGAGGAFMISQDPTRLERVVSFLDPFADRLDSGYQAVQSLYAIGSGGLFGMGLGKSRQKFLYIPEPQNDFIFAILCEELGFVGVVLVIILFAALIWRGIIIAINAPDLFGSLMAVGIISTIGVQVLLNIAVVTSSMPVTGVSLPFFSYGGTSLLILMTEVGIMLNISRYSVKTRKSQ